MSELESIIDLCRMVQRGAIDPFDIDFEYVIQVIRKHYPQVKTSRELCLNAQALKELTLVLEEQGKWIHHKSTTLYKDPFLLAESLRALDLGAIAQVFLRSWHPVVDMGQISAQTLANSLAYWGDLAPLETRWRGIQVEERETGYTSEDEARRLGLIPEEGFTEALEALWAELGERVGPGGTIPYWDWVGSGTYEETVRRAYLTAFLVGAGYAQAHWDRMSGEYTITHNPKPQPAGEELKTSLPIMVDYEEWKRWREE